MSDIKEILDLYVEHGPSGKVQTAFNALAAGEPKFGKVALRLRVRPTDMPRALTALSSTTRTMPPKEKAQIKRLIESGTLQENPAKAFSNLPTKSAKQIAEPEKQ